MSIWTDIIDSDDVDFSLDKNNIDINYASDDQGNFYVTVPVEFVIKAMEKEGYKVIKQ